MRWVQIYQVKWDLRECLVAMSMIHLASPESQLMKPRFKETIQVKRTKCDGEQPMDIYGLVSSGDLIQLHKLTSTGEVSSSPPLLFTTQGLPAIWSYLREIIHAIQLTAAPPPTEEQYIAKTGHPTGPPTHELEKLLISRRWNLNPTGTPLEAPSHDCEGADEEEARRRERRDVRAARPGISTRVSGTWESRKVTNTSEKSWMLWHERR